MKNEKLDEQFLDAVEDQDLKLVIKLLEQGADPNSTSMSSSSALHIAALNSKDKDKDWCIF